MSRFSSFVPALLVLSACGGAAPHPETPRSRTVVEMEELRITARRTDEGGFELDSYDAETLFARATELLNQRRCADAVPLYDRLVSEFRGSRYRSPALYNSGLCLDDLDRKPEAADRFERLLREERNSADVPHATFQLARLGVELERWDRAVELSEALLTRTDLTADDRMEALARRCQGLFGRGDLDEAFRQARSALAWYQTRPENDRVHDEFFAAAVNYVLAETFRTRADGITIPQAAVEEQRATLERRASFMLDAQREYFNTMRLTNAHWAAAAGFRIGAMYDRFYDDIMGAPTPPPRNPLRPGTEQVYEEEYRREIRRIIEPLIRHAIRYWELTLMMVERTGVRTEWTDRVHQGLERARARLVGGVVAPAVPAPEGAEALTPPAAR